MNYQIEKFSLFFYIEFRKFISLALILFVLTLTSCKSSKNMSQKKTITKKFTITTIEALVPPPPPDLDSKFYSLQDWLQNIIDQDNALKNIGEFRFGLSQHPDDYFIYLVGVNTYNDSYKTQIKIEFRPQNMYFKLPRVYWEGLDRQQLTIKLIKYLSDFTNTQKFKTSFLSNAQRIIFWGKTVVIWSKE